MSTKAAVVGYVVDDTVLSSYSYVTFLFWKAGSVSYVFCSWCL